MAGHHEAVVTVTVGNDTEGLKVDNDLVEALYPNLSDAQVANGIRDGIRLLLFLTYMSMNPGLPYAQAAQYIDDHVTDTH